MPASPYVATAKAAAAKYGIPAPILMRQINAESGWRPDARSSAGAEGIMQLMPGTARSLGVTNPFDPVQNIDGGARYLKEQYDRFGSWDKALAAYNAGPGNVENGAWQHIPETTHYVHEILGGLGDVSAPPAGAGVQPTMPQMPAGPAPISNADFGLLNSIAQGAAPSVGQLLASIPKPTDAVAPASPLDFASTPGSDKFKFANPVPSASFERVDQGVDYMAKSPVGAVGPGQIISITKGMAGGTGDIIKERLARPVHVNGRTYDYVYYSEEKPLVRQGEAVQAGQPVMGAGGNEIGFLDSGGHMAPLIGGLGAGTQSTQMGADFLAFLRSLGVR